MIYTELVLSLKLYTNLKKKYSYISDTVYNGMIAVGDGDLFGKVDLKCNLIIPIIYHNMLNNNEHIGFHIVSIYNKWGIIDDKNEILVPLKYNIEFFL